jgi:hypothetical protein
MFRKMLGRKILSRPIKITYKNYDGQRIDRGKNAYFLSAPEDAGRRAAEGESTAKGEGMGKGEG